MSEEENTGEDAENTGESQENEPKHKLMLHRNSGKVTMILKSLEEQKDNLEEMILSRDSENNTLMTWSIINDKYALVEYLLKVAPADYDKMCFGFADRKAITAYDKLVAERNRIAAEEEGKKVAAAEKAARIAAGEEEEEEEEEAQQEEGDGEPKEVPPTFEETLATELELTVEKVNEIRDLGYFEGGTDDEGNRDGHGVVIFPNGDIYSGYYEKNVRCGKGLYSYGATKESKDVYPYYCGTFKDNMRHGFGRLVYPDGSIYEGHFKEDKKDGKGTYKYLPSSDEYKGTWKAGKRHGEGLYTYSSDKTTLKGTWENGDFSFGQFSMTNGYIFEGSFIRDTTEGRTNCFIPKPDTTGVYIFPNNGVRQKGQFVNGSWKSLETTQSFS